MAKVGKKYAEAAKLVDRSKAYTIEEAVALAKQTSTVKFDEVLSMGPKRLVLTLAIRNYIYFVQLRIAKVKTSLLGPIDSTSSNLTVLVCFAKATASSIV